MKELEATPWERQKAYNLTWEGNRGSDAKRNHLKIGGA
jgi:hypothetical protein